MKHDAINALADGLSAMTAEDRAALAAKLSGGADLADVLTATAGPSGSSVAKVAARQSGTPSPSPEQADASPRGRTVLTAAGGLYGIPENTELTDRRAFATALALTLQRLDRKGPARGKVLVASASTEYPENRRLGENQEENAWILDSVTSPQALTATGGVCLPVNVDYAVPTWATAERPIRDALPSFQATRGGLRFVKPLDVGDWTAASSVWTAATDASPGVETKPVVAMTCGAEELVYVNAIPTRIGFGNMQSRFAPEQVAANTDLAIAAAARVAENNLLELIFASCVKGVTTGTASQLGAVRELLSSLGMVLAQQRQLHRLPSTQAFTCIMPRWLREELRIDLAREQAHAYGPGRDALAVTDAEIDTLFTARNIRPVWHFDSGPATESVSQLFEAAVKGAAKKFPAKASCYLFPEGAIQHLDAGRLDLGVVRDSTLDATNDYEVMVEVFESIAMRGYTGAALQVVVTLEATGASAALLDMKSKPPA